MKQLINKLSQKERIVLGALLGLAVIVWFGGPYLFINNQYPLQSGEKRFYIISLFVLVAILAHIFKPQKAVPEKSVALAPTHPDTVAKTHTLEGRFEGALRFLKKTFISHNGKSIRLAQLPWALIIGPANAGKTTLLANANVNYILTKQFKQEKIPSTASFDWWVTRDLVLIDSPGAFLNDRNHFLWGSFLTLARKFRGKHALNTIVIALPLQDLMAPPAQKKQLILDIRHKISQLREQFGDQLNFYLIVTKCDQLAGFAEFFNESSTEDLAQAWGITLPTCNANDNLLYIFTQRFNALIKRLNTQLLSRLHQERNPNLRPAIKDFPLQIERLKDTLLHFLKMLNIRDLNLHGLYLTSAIQAQEETAIQSQVINPHANQALQLIRTPASTSKPHFIRQLISHGLLSSADHAAKPKLSKTHRKRQAIYAASIAAVVFTAFLLGRDFQQSVLKTYAIQNNLTQYRFAIAQQPNQNDTLLKALPLLNAIQTSTTSSNTKAHFPHFLSFYSTKSQKTADSIYQQSLQSIVLPQIKTTLENYLTNPNHKNNLQDYAVLKAYLMLGDANNLQLEYVLNTLQLLLPAINKQAAEDLSGHIQAAFALTKKPIEIDNALVANIRSRLLNLNRHELAFVILKNMGNNSIENTLTVASQNETPLFVNDPSSNHIPNLYTANAFNTVLTQQIPLAASEALQGNWVLGNAEVLSNPATINSFAQQLRSRYIAHYVEAWEELLDDIQLVPPTNLAQTDAAIESMMSNSSPLLQVLRTIKDNTSFAPVMGESQKLKAINALLVNAHNDQENTLYQVFVRLRQLHFYLQNIITTQDVGQAAFDTAKNRMQDSTVDPITQLHKLADQTQEPMKSWLNELASQSWNFILQESGHHIDNAWQVNVATIYHSHLAMTAAQDIDIPQFANFVGKQGVLANFFTRYLKPFVNDTDKQWQWKVVDNQKIPFSNKVLEQLQQTAKLQNLSRYALFTEGHKNPELLHLELPEKLV